MNQSQVSEELRASLTTMVEIDIDESEEVCDADVESPASESGARSVEANKHRATRKVGVVAMFGTLLLVASVAALVGTAGGYAIPKSQPNQRVLVSDNTIAQASSEAQNLGGLGSTSRLASCMPSRLSHDTKFSCLHGISPEDAKAALQQRYPTMMVASLFMHEDGKITLDKEGNDPTTVEEHSHCIRIISMMIEADDFVVATAYYFQPEVENIFEEHPCLPRSLPFGDQPLDCLLGRDGDILGSELKATFIRANVQVVKPGDRMICNLDRNRIRITVDDENIVTSVVNA